LEDHGVSIGKLLLGGLNLGLAMKISRFNHGKNMVKPCVAFLDVKDYGKGNGPKYFMKHEELNLEGPNPERSWSKE